MSALDWVVLISTIGFIVAWGAWKSRGITDIDGYLKGDNELKWLTIGLSIMATQASAITFLSVPGQAFEDGMGFIQFYFGLPIAMVIISAFIVPIYYRLKVYTAYEYLETRFDLKTRLLGAFLFLIQRGLAAGITIYAPAIILSSILGWSLNATNMIIGGVVIMYTVSGGTKAVSHTQKQQMVVIMAGMITAAVVVVRSLPSDVSIGDALSLAGALGRMNIVDFELDFSNRYNFWSGITGGLFLALSYFGTDQSQVQRYLSGKSLKESRLGLLFNGILKIPMQFLILMIGVMLFAFHQFSPPPIFFNEPTLERVYETEYAPEMEALDAEWDQAWVVRSAAARQFVDSHQAGDEAGEQAARQALLTAEKATNAIRARGKELIAKALPSAETKDSDYIFIRFVLHHLPSGLVGLLVAVILSAAMSSTASELNALGATTTVDIYRRALNKDASDAHYLRASKAFTVMWGLIAVAFATFASLLDNLIQAVNILGSIFYGTILGIFLVAFFVKRVHGNAVFMSALLSQATVIALYLLSDIGFLWYNVIGCVLVMGTSLVVQAMMGRASNA
ncbi:MAG: Na+/proline symporter [Myxococcota bacterium]